MSQVRGATLADSLHIQRRVIGALLLREMLTRYGRHNIGFLWLFVEPMLFTIGVTIVWSSLRSLHGSSLPIAAFALTGYSSVLLWRNMPGRCIGAIKPNASLMHHRYVKVMDVFLARLILEAMGASMSFIALSIFFLSIGLVSPPQDMLLVLEGWLMLIWFGMSLALFLGALAERSELVDKFWHPMAYFLFPMSGAAISVDVLSPSVRDFFLLFPMVHGVEIVRDGYFGSLYNAHYDIGYMALCCLFLSLAALIQLRIISKDPDSE